MVTEHGDRFGTIPFFIHYNGAVLHKRRVAVIDPIRP